MPFYPNASRPHHNAGRHSRTTDGQVKTVKGRTMVVATCDECQVQYNKRPEWQDTRCGSCNIVQQICQAPAKYGITSSLLEFIGRLTPEEALLVGKHLHPPKDKIDNPQTPLVDLLTALSIERRGGPYVEDFVRTPCEFELLYNCLSGLPAVKETLMVGIHKGLAKDRWWVYM